jgi:hypothetical protein
VNVIDEHYAAMVLEWIRIHGGGNKSSHTPKSMCDSLMGQFGLSMTEQRASRVLDTLVSMGCAQQTFSPLTNGHYQINRDHAVRIFGAPGWTKADGVKIERLEGAAEKYPVLDAYLRSDPSWAAFVMAELQSTVGLGVEGTQDIEIIDVPASDRIVTLGDNSAGDLVGASTELVELVEAEAAIDGDTGLRDQFVGQLKAGIELIREKTFNAYLLHQTVISLLGRLIEKYKGQAIGETAKKLWGLLLDHVFS